MVSSTRSGISAEILIHHRQKETSGLFGPLVLLRGNTCLSCSGNPPHCLNDLSDIRRNGNPTEYETNRVIRRDHHDHHSGAIIPSPDSRHRAVPVQNRFRFLRPDTRASNAVQEAGHIPEIKYSLNLRGTPQRRRQTVSPRLAHISQILRGNIRTSGVVRGVAREKRTSSTFEREKSEPFCPTETAATAGRATANNREAARKRRIMGPSNPGDV